MELRWLTAFVTVVNERGFARAATVLYCSQPTISSQIAELERELGTTLFARDRRPVRLTPAGEVFLAHARRILNEIDTAHANVTDVVGVTRGTVRLGTYPSATAGWIPTLLEKFHATYPNVAVHITELGGAQLPQAALDGEVELFLRQTTPPLDSKHFTHKLLWEEDFKVLIPKCHYLAQSHAPISAATLCRQPLITTGKYHQEGLLAHPFWRRLGHTPEVTYAVTQPQSLVALVRAGLGVGVTTALALNVSDPTGVTVRAIDAPDAVRRVALYRPSRRALSPAATALATLIEQDPTPPPECRLITDSGAPG